MSGAGAATGSGSSARGRTRVVFCWHSVSGYMAACWRALSASADVEVLVVTQSPDTGGQTPFDRSLMSGIAHELVPPAAMERPDGLRGPVANFRPDVLVVGGWFIPACNGLVDDPALRSVRKINAIDRPRRHNWQDWYHRLNKGRFLRSFDVVFVPGERSFQFARFLGVSDERIRRGTYGVDCRGLWPIWERRSARPGGWPRSFVFMGRYAPEKGVDVLASAYRRYRGMVSDPWPLVCHGRGDLGSHLAGVEGIEDRGFVQPADQPEVLASQGVFVMPSRFDPWPLVIVEASAAGLPVVCTNACGSAVEVVRPMVNGVYAADGNAEDLAARMAWMHTHHDDLPVMGRAGRDLAQAYSAEMWARRWSEAIREVVTSGRG